MMATGEVMAIGNSFEAALLKGVRSLEIKQFTLMREFSKQHSLEGLNGELLCLMTKAFLIWRAYQT